MSHWIARLSAGLMMLGFTAIALPALANQTYLEFHTSGAPSAQPNGHKVYTGSIPVRSYRLNLTIPPPKGTAGAAKRRKADSSLRVTGVDSNTAQTLMQDATQGVILSWVRLVIVNDEGLPLETYTFKHPYVTAVSASSSGNASGLLSLSGNASGRIRFSFNFRKVTLVHETAF